MAGDSDDRRVFLGDSAHPKAPELLKKSLQPLHGKAPSDPGGIGGSAQPKAPPPTQQLKPPPGDD